MALKTVGRSRTSRKSPQERHSDPTQIFRFLDLPLEIRNMIYGYLFTNPDHKLVFGRRYVVTKSGEKSTVRWKLASRWQCKENTLTSDEMDEKAGVLIPMNLLRTCRQIYAETHWIPMTANIFAFHNGPVFHRFCLKIGKKRDLLREIEIKESGAFGANNLRQYDYYNLPGLKVLYLRSQSTFEKEIWYPALSIEIELTKALRGVMGCLGRINRQRGPLSTFLTSRINVRFIVPLENPLGTEALFEMAQERCKQFLSEMQQWQSVQHSRRIDEQTFELLLEVKSRWPTRG